MISAFFRGLHVNIAIVHSSVTAVDGSGTLLACWRCRAGKARWRSYLEGQLHYRTCMRHLSPLMRQKRPKLRTRLALMFPLNLILGVGHMGVVSFQCILCLLSTVCFWGGEGDLLLISRTSCFRVLNTLPNVHQFHAPVVYSQGRTI